MKFLSANGSNGVLIRSIISLTSVGIGKVVTMERIMTALKKLASSIPSSFPIDAAARVAESCGTVIRPAQKA